MGVILCLVAMALNSDENSSYFGNIIRTIEHTDIKISSIKSNVNYKYLTDTIFISYFERLINCNMSTYNQDTVLSKYFENEKDNSKAYTIIKNYFNACDCIFNSKFRENILRNITIFSCFIEIFPSVYYMADANNDFSMEGFIDILERCVDNIEEGGMYLYFKKVYHNFK